MQFQFDEDKRQANIQKHGVDLRYAALIFEGPVLTKSDNRYDYGEDRLISLGLIDDKPFVVVHTERDGEVRLISAWKGGRREYVKYKESFPR